MNKVFIAPSETGALVNAYQSNPEYGYITVKSEELQLVSGSVRRKSRSALIRGEVKDLTAFVKTFAKSGMLDGKIVVREFLESELPASYKSRISTKMPWEDAIASYVKRAGQDGVECTVGGERILRFADYDPTGSEQDTFVQHDNQEAIQLTREALKARAEALANAQAKEGAKLPAEETVATEATLPAGE